MRTVACAGTTSRLTSYIVDSLIFEADYLLKEFYSHSEPYKKSRTFITPRSLMLSSFKLQALCWSSKGSLPFPHGMEFLGGLWSVDDVAFLLIILAS